MKIVISCAQMSLVVKACSLLHAIFIEESSQVPPARHDAERGLTFFGLQGTGPLLQVLAVSHALCACFGACLLWITKNYSQALFARFRIWV